MKILKLEFSIFSNLFWGYVTVQIFAETEKQLEEEYVKIMRTQKGTEKTYKLDDTLKAQIREVPFPVSVVLSMDT